MSAPQAGAEDAAQAKSGPRRRGAVKIPVPKIDAENGPEAKAGAPAAHDPVAEPVAELPDADPDTRTPDSSTAPNSGAAPSATPVTPALPVRVVAPRVKVADTAPVVEHVRSARKPATAAPAAVVSVDVAPPASATVATAQPGLVTAVLKFVSGAAALINRVFPVGQWIRDLGELLYVAARRVKSFVFNESPTATVQLTGQNTVTGVMTGTIVGSDADGDRLIYKVVAQPEHGTVVVAADGAFTYTPDPEWAHETGGLDGFLVRVADTGIHMHWFQRGGGRVSVPVSLQVGTVNQAPQVTVAATEPSAEDGSVVIAVDVSDADGDSTELTVTSAQQYGKLTDNGDGTYTYLPDRDLAAANPGVTEKISFTAVDQYGKQSTTGIDVPVTLVNKAPALTVGVDQPSEVDGSIIITIGADDPDGDTVLVSPSTTPKYGTLTDNGDGTYTYVPDRALAQANPGAVEIIEYTVDDQHGVTGSFGVELAVTFINSEPVITAEFPDFPRGLSDSSTVFLPVITDADGDPAHIISVEAIPLAEGATFGDVGWAEWRQAYEYNLLGDYKDLLAGAVLVTYDDGFGNTKTSVLTLPTNRWLTIDWSVLNGDDEANFDVLPPDAEVVLDLSSLDIQVSVQKAELIEYTKAAQNNSPLANQTNLFGVMSNKIESALLAAGMSVTAAGITAVAVTIALAFFPIFI